MTSKKEFAKRIEKWANEWYEWSWNNKETQGYQEFKELRKIIQEMKK